MSQRTSRETTFDLVGSGGGSPSEATNPEKTTERSSPRQLGFLLILAESPINIRKQWVQTIAARRNPFDPAALQKLRRE